MYNSIATTSTPPLPMPSSSSLPPSHHPSRSNSSTPGSSGTTGGLAYPVSASGASPSSSTVEPPSNSNGSPHQSNMPSPTPSATSHHSHGKQKAPPKLRVQIPGESSMQPGAIKAEEDADIKLEEKTENDKFAKPATPNRATAAEPSTAVGPPSALPSQFAQNLFSPSTFYPEFYQQNELPSPLNFSATPTTAHAFNWPTPSSSAQTSTARDYKPSPLAKLENTSSR
ncbi:hypothetical protein BX666DRAFT_647736 [Dichotomocladium elegans]|nr:hypothetical protein BX666DRAFT_647736 [Dichotomocladium elegans]